MSLSFFSPAPRPENERERQRAVDLSGILRAPPDPELHRLVATATRAFGVSMGGLSILDRDRMWLTARIGIDLPETSRAISFCAHTILHPETPLAIPDTRDDERFAGNPFVQDEPSVRFYAGAAIRSRRGYPLGTLFVLDLRPHHEELPLAILASLAGRASQAIAEIDHADASG